MARKAQVGSYTMPAGLAKEVFRELEVEEKTGEKSQQDFNKNDYHAQRYNRSIELNNNLSYKEQMSVRALEREEKRISGVIEDTKPETVRIRKKRWDVTPEEYELQKQKLLATIEKVPVINGLVLTNDVLDKILPSSYRILETPKNYTPDLTIAPDVSGQVENYYVPPAESKLQHFEDPEVEVEGIVLKQEDKKYFGKLAKYDEDAKGLTSEERKELRVMKLLLQVKNGLPLVRKKALRQITETAKVLGPDVLFSQILPILLEPALDVLERHLLVKLVGRLLFQFDTLIRPYTHKILVVVSPLLIDENFTLRLEAREIISSLTKAAGLATMIATLRPDLDHVDEYVRNITSRVFAVVANTLGLVSFLPFLKAVIKSKKSWTARHTGIKIVQQLCVLLGGGNGNSILPFLPQLIDILQPALSDEVLQVRILSANTLAQLAESVRPYGIESFEPILEPAWVGLKRHRGRGLASFLKCIGSIVPLMQHDPNYEEYSNFYTREVMTIIIREFNSPDNDMKKSILRIMSDLPLSKMLFQKYNSEIIKPFFRYFWNRRTASDSQLLNRLVVEATFKLAVQFDFFDILEQVVIYSKDENENLRIMSLEAINKMLSSGKDSTIGLDSKLELRLVDGVLYAFQEQTISHRIYLNSFGTVINSLGIRVKPHINSILSSILYRLKNKDPEVRQQACDLISLITGVIKLCSGDEIIMKLILVLYESLGEVYPEVLGSILNALYACIETVDKMTLYTMQNPSINQILPTLTPVLKNRQEKVQEACVKLVGLIADKNAESINAKEWMRICFELLDLLKSTKKRIRIAANSTFGFIAKTIGPQDVLAMLLNNLRVQERQLRVCTAVAIGIVAENCAPFTVLPALMNEYRIPEKNVQNGVLKALSFLFEYINGDMTRDYIYAITPLLEDALTDRDQVHRQTAATVIKHISLNVVGLTHDGYHDILIHFFNLLLPNVFETSPHVINRILESIDALRIALGNGPFASYLWAGLFHPARKVRVPYWKMYNSAYVQNGDSLVPYYPKIEKLPDSEVNYAVEELDIFI